MDEQKTLFKNYILKIDFRSYRNLTTIARKLTSTVKYGISLFCSPIHFEYLKILAIIFESFCTKDPQMGFGEVNVEQAHLKKSQVPPPSSSFPPL